MLRFSIFILLLSNLCININFAQSDNKKNVIATVNETIFTRYDLEQRKKILSIKKNDTNLQKKQILDHLILEELYIEFLTNRSIFISESEILEEMKKIISIIDQYNKSSNSEIIISEKSIHRYSKGLIAKSQIEQMLIFQNKPLTSNLLFDMQTSKSGLEVEFWSFKLKDYTKKSFKKFQALNKKISQLNSRQKKQFLNFFKNYADLTDIKKINTNSLFLPARERSIVHDFDKNKVSSIFLNDSQQFEFVLICNKESYFDQQKTDMLFNKVMMNIMPNAIEEFNKTLKKEAFIELF
ncbi:MAG: hypothetical protein ISN64_03940 [Rickettsia sp.]|nr:hypothetical protein [Rickettsia sp.]